MNRILASALALAAFSLAPALGQEPAATADKQAGRFELKSVEGGFLRLDRDNGVTSLCKPAGDGYACRPTAEGQSADAAMIASLEARVAALEAKVRTLPADPSGARSTTRDPTLDLPSDEQVDRVAGFLERALKRLKKIAEEAQKDGDQKL